MTGMKEAARAVVVLKVLADAVIAEQKTVRPLTASALAESGAERVRATLDDGTDLGAVTLSKPRETPRVVDEVAFLAWVQAEHPSEVVSTVRDSFRAAVLAAVKKTGELPPGVDLRIGDPSLSVRLAPGAQAAVLAAIRSGALPLAITAGGEA